MKTQIIWPWILIGGGYF